MKKLEHGVLLNNRPMDNEDQVSGNPAALPRNPPSDECVVTPDTAQIDNFPALKSEENVTTTNALALLSQAIQFSNESRISACMDVIDQYTQAVIKSDSFLDADAQTLSLVLQRDTLNTAELDLFDAVVRWSIAECKRKNLNPSLENQYLVSEPLLLCIRLPVIQAENRFLKAKYPGSGPFMEKETDSLLRHINKVMLNPFSASCILRTGPIYNNLALPDSPASTTVVNNNEERLLTRKESPTNSNCLGAKADASYDTASVTQGSSEYQLNVISSCSSPILGAEESMPDWSTKNQKFHESDPITSSPPLLDFDDDRDWVCDPALVPHSDKHSDTNVLLPPSCKSNTNYANNSSFQVHGEEFATSSSALVSYTDEHHDMNVAMPSSCKSSASNSSSTTLCTTLGTSTSTGNESGKLPGMKNLRTSKRSRAFDWATLAEDPMVGKFILTVCNSGWQLSPNERRNSYAGLNIDSEKMVTVLKYTRKLRLPTLETECLKFFKETLNLHNVSNRLDEAKKYKEDQLQSLCQNFIEAAKASTQKKPDSEKLSATGLTTRANEVAGEQCKTVKIAKKVKLQMRKTNKKSGKSVAKPTKNSAQTSQVAKKFECKVCGMIFNVKCSLQFHLMSHAGVKNLECKQCGMRFLKIGTLNRHLLTHGKLKFTCSICNRSYSRKDTLTVHIKSHKAST